MTIQDIRAEFPFLKTGMIYLNHAATGPWPRTAERRARDGGRRAALAK